MGKLKLFISHSSRLDDDNGAQDSDENWALLKGLCDEIRSREFGVEVEVLVDQSIGSGNDWEKYLNLWLAECHAAIILYSKRALTRSDWVQKEATILNWRWQVEPSFPLLPIFFEDETSIADATDSIWQTIGLDQINSITCHKSPATIVDHISHQNNFKNLLSRLQAQQVSTPFTNVADELKVFLNDNRIFDDLKLAWNSLDDADKPSDPIGSIDDLVNNLIRYLLTTPNACLEKLLSFAENLSSREAKERMQEVHGAVRAIWVDAGAASQIPTARDSDKILALNGMHLNTKDRSGQVNHFTVDRYIKKIWHKTNKGIFVPLTDQFTPDKVEIAIWKECGIYDEGTYPAQNSPRIPRLRVRANRKEFIIIFIPAKDAERGIPDSERAQEIVKLQEIYPKLRTIIGTGEQPLTAELPGIFLIKPALDTEIEDNQYLCDCEIRTILTA
jgi:hypothetical protein